MNDINGKKQKIYDAIDYVSEQQVSAELEETVINIFSRYKITYEYFYLKLISIVDRPIAFITIFFAWMLLFVLAMSTVGSYEIEDLVPYFFAIGVLWLLGIISVLVKFIGYIFYFIINIFLMLLIFFLALISFMFIKEENLKKWNLFIKNYHFSKILEKSLLKNE